MNNPVWKKCSACKKEILLGQKYYICSVSSCQRERLNLVYCNPSCWDAHNAVERHRDAGAMEMFAPAKQPSNSPPPESNAPKRIIVNSNTPNPAPSIHSSSGLIETDILVVVSKVKKYITDRAQFNTSGDVMEALTQIIVKVCDEAIRRARMEGRKTVMERDIPEIKF